MTRKDPQLNLRLPADLKEMLEEAAIASKRSVTAETVERLRASFLHDRNITNTLFLMARLEMRVVELELESLGYYTVGRALRSKLRLAHLARTQAAKFNAEQAEELNQALSDVQDLLESADKIFGTAPAIANRAQELIQQKTDELKALRERTDDLFKTMVEHTKNA